MNIGGHNLTKEVLIIAEIGNNHEGSYQLAEEMIGLAAEAGANAVKFQTIIPERLVSENSPDSFTKFERFRLSFSEYKSLATTAHNEGMLFLSTPFDIESALFLRDLVPAFKISSGDNNFWQLLKVVGNTGLPIILSTGLMSLDEVKKTSQFIEKIWLTKNIEQQLALLHCVSSYPTPTKQANLLAIRDLALIVDTVGYSDHTLGIEAPILAVALGARIIEKHFTIDKNQSSFRDHHLSADPHELKEMVRRIRLTSEYLGSGGKIIQECEKPNLMNMRRSIIAKRDIQPNRILQIHDIDWVRPGGGLFQEDEVVGKSAKRLIKRGERINMSDLNKDELDVSIET